MEEIASNVLLGEDDMEEAAPPALPKGRDWPSQFPWLQVGGVPTAVWERATHSHTPVKGRAEVGCIPHGNCGQIREGVGPDGRRAHARHPEGAGVGFRARPGGGDRGAAETSGTSTEAGRPADAAGASAAEADCHPCGGPAAQSHRTRTLLGER